MHGGVFDILIPFNSKKIFFLVLTKVIVYAGIAVLATEMIPLWFELVGLGVKSSV